MSDHSPFTHDPSGDLGKTTEALRSDAFRQVLAMQLDQLDLDTPHITRELDAALSAQGWSMGAFKALPKDAVSQMVRLLNKLSAASSSGRPDKIKAIIEALRPYQD